MANSSLPYGLTSPVKETAEINNSLTLPKGLKLTKYNWTQLSLINKISLHLEYVWGEGKAKQMHVIAEGEGMPSSQCQDYPCEFGASCADSAEGPHCVCSQSCPEDDLQVRLCPTGLFINKSYHLSSYRLNIYVVYQWRTSPPLTGTFNFLQT